MKTKLYRAPVRPEKKIISFIPLVRGADPTHPGETTIFKSRLPKDFAITAVEFTNDVSAADFILVPQAITKDSGAPFHAYLDSIRALAREHGKEIIIFTGGDLSHDVFVDDMIVLKGTQYRYLLRENEIIVPGFVEDMESGIDLREKKGRPVVGFCGWAAFPSLIARLRFEARNFLCDMEALLGNPHAGAHKKGLLFRRKAMHALAAASEIETRFIVRTTFSGNATTIALSPMQARAEYGENMARSHFALAPKGEANNSMRFYEAFSMGTIPVLVDTECCLPLEDRIPYDDLIVRVPWRDVGRTADYVLKKWESLTPDSYAQLRKDLAATYRHSLRYDAFMNRLFSEILTPERARKGKRA
jgi:hypothetical protein